MPLNPPLPPFTAETAAEKARRTEDAWNTRDPARVVLSRWRNRAEFLEGRDAIKAFQLDHAAAGKTVAATPLDRNDLVLPEVDNTSAGLAADD
jgi:hypothetical protein